MGAKHSEIIRQQPISASETARQEAAGPGILSLRLLTAVPLAKMKAFYHDLLGLPVLVEESHQLTFGAGQTQLTFVAAEAGQKAPFYHFAFNIPQNKLLLAREWQQQRTPLILAPPHRRDSDYPDDVRYFPDWNAHAIFFWDPADNIVEYIARHNLKNDAPGPFTSKDILCVSEIGLVVDNVPAVASQLREALALEPYPPGTDQLWALGDEQGLLLCLSQGLLWGSNTDKPKTFDVFPATVMIRGLKPIRYLVPNFPYEILVSSGV